MTNRIIQINYFHYKLKKKILNFATNKFYFKTDVVFIPKVFQTASDADPSFYSLHTRILSPGVKLQKRELDHFPPTSAEVKNEWRYTSTPAMRLLFVDGYNYLLHTARNIQCLIFGR